MGWTEEQFKEFCARLGIDPAKALKTGQADILAARSLKQKESSHVRTERKRAERAAKGARAAGIPYAERKQDPGDALGPPTSRTQSELEAPGSRSRVRITIRGVRVRLLDPDNFIAGCKMLVDGLVRSGIAADDSAQAVASGQVAFFYEQALTTAYSKECTEIEIEWNEVTKD